MRQQALDTVGCDRLSVTRIERVAVVVTTILAMFGAAIAQQLPPANDKPVLSTNSAYRLGPGDVIKITVLRQDLLTQDGVRIGNDGRIRLPMLPDPVFAACSTEAELASTITEKYRKLILKPEVYVSTREFNSNMVSVIGAVIAPGRFQLQRPVRLLEVLALVNGPTANASTELQILRTGSTDLCSGEDPSVEGPAASDGEPQIISLRINDVLTGSAESNPFLRSGDIIRIGQAEVKQAYIVGNVLTATTINLKDPVSLSTAIAMAGGLAKGAQIEKVKISRQEPGSLNKTDLFVNLKEIRDGSKPDVLLQANDIVDVPGPSGTKKFFSDIIRTIVPVFTRIPVILP